MHSVSFRRFAPNRARLSLTSLHRVLGGVFSGPAWLKSAAFSLVLGLTGSALAGCSVFGGAGNSKLNASDIRAAFDKAEAAGFSAVKRGDFAAARAHWLKALDLRPDDAYMLSNLALIEGSLGENDDAVLHAARAVQLTPTSPALSVNHGVVLEQAGYPAQAVGAYRRALELNPRFAPALLGIAFRGFQDGELKLAQQYFSDVVRLYPQLADGYAGLAAVAVQRGDWEWAAAQMAAAADKQGAGSTYMAAAGALYFRLGEAVKAQRYLDEAVKKSPGLADALLLRGELAWRQGAYDEARHYLARAVKADEPGALMAGSLLHRGELASELSRPQLAEAALTAVMQQRGAPEKWYARAYVLLGAMAVSRHEFERALGLFEKARARGGAIAPVAAGLAASHHGRALTGPLENREATLLEAENYYRESLEYKENPRLRVSLAKLYWELADVVEAPYRRGKYRLAEMQLKEALRHKPGLVEAHVRLALLLEKLHRFAEARTSLEKALSLDPKATRIRFLYANMLRSEADRLNDPSLRVASNRQYARIMEQDSKYVPAQIGWFLTRATEATEMPPEARHFAQAPTSETILPYSEDGTEEAPVLEDLLPLFELEEEFPDGVIPIKDDDRRPLYSIEGTGTSAVNADDATHAP